MSVSATKSSNRGHRAGIFDIRNIIGALLGIDGVIILLVGIFGDAEEDKTGGVNANLWAGIVLVVMSAIFLGWAWLRPVVVPDDFEGDHDDEGRPAGH
jgi:drug/metabolite transporter (DMT)-like permease